MHFPTFALNILTLIPATVVAVAVPESLTEGFPIDRREEHYDGNFVPLVLGDGRHKIAVFENGYYEGYIIEDKENGTMSCYDAKDNLIDPREYETEEKKKDGEGDENYRPVDQERRQIVSLIVRLAQRFGPIIARWGRRVWDFIYCVGVSPIWECSQSFVNCAGMGNPPWKCASGIACLATKGRASIRQCL